MLIVFLSVRDVYLMTEASRDMASIMFFRASSVSCTLFANVAIACRMLSESITDLGPDIICDT